MSKQITRDEARYLFLNQMAHLVHYWANTDSRTHRGDDEDDINYRLSGLMHSTLCAIDGNAGALPGFMLAPEPHESDKEFAIDNGFDYYSQEPEDIAGGLHEEIHRYLRGEVEKPKNLVTFSDHMAEESKKFKVMHAAMDKPRELLTFKINPKTVNNEMLTSLQEHFSPPFGYEYPLRPIELAQAFCNIHHLWFEEEDNSLRGRREEAIAVCYAWATSHLDVTDNQHEMIYVLNKFQNEFMPWFKQRTPKTLDDILAENYGDTPMPDFTTEYYYHCASAEDFQITVQGSKGRTYIVRWDDINHLNRNSVQYDYSCTCESYKFGRGKPCKHIKQVKESGEHCNWQQFMDGGSVDPEHPCCPKCGQEVRSMGYAV